MNFIKKIISALIICVTLAPTAILAENEKSVIYYPDNTLYGYSVHGDIALYNSNHTDFNSCIEKIVNQFKQIPYSDDELPLSIDISEFTLPADDINDFKEQLGYALQIEHPELFFLAGYFMVQHNNNILTSISMEDISVKNDNGEIITLHPYSMSKTEIKRRQSIIDAETRKILSYINNDMTPLEKALTVHDYIIANYSYDTRVYIDNTLASRRLDTMVMQKTGVCEGYTRLFGYMMDILEIPWAPVPSEKHTHIWNKIQLDGNWYHIDLTYDDPLFSDSSSFIPISSIVYHKYFLLSDNAIKNIDNGHTAWNDETIYPANDNTYDSYFLHTNPRQLAYDDGNWYYFDTENRLCSIDVNSISGNPEILYEDSSSFTWRYVNKYSSLVKYRGNLFFNSDNTLYKYNIQSGNTEVFYTHTFDNKNIYGLHIQNDTVYLEIADNINNGVSETISLPLIEYPIYSVSASQYGHSDTINISVDNSDIQNIAENSDILYVAEYKDNILVNITQKKVTDIEHSFEYTLADICSEEIKVFVWNEAYMPLSDFCAVELNTEKME